MHDDSEPGPQAALAPPAPDGAAAPELPILSLDAAPEASPDPGPARVALPPPLPGLASPWTPPAPRVLASTVFLAVVTTISLVADLVTKGWAKARLSGFEPKLHGPKKIEIWKDHFDFIFAQNPGGAW